MLLYVFFFGSTDAGEPIAQAIALGAAMAMLHASAGRRSVHEVARS
ncbi:MAG: hypothetical protein HYX56_02825 [Chloroflexi bacterium]|nr:hypothetical protein [Chloroflexota bacterium]